MEQATNRSFSVQAQLIRQMQRDDGLHPCYATPDAEHCAKSEHECCWRHDCYHETEASIADHAA